MEYYYNRDNSIKQFKMTLIGKEFFMLADYHVHTEFSDGSEYLLEEYIKKAI